MTDDRVIVVGCGVFGVTAAVELGRRGYSVRVLEASAPPAPRAASTDVSKIVRVTGGDSSELGRRVLQGWREWSERWQRDGHPQLFHEVGTLRLDQRSDTSGSSDRDRPARAGDPRRRRFPAWSPALEENLTRVPGGYVESAGAVWALVQEAQAHGVEILPLTPARRLLEAGGRVAGVEDAAGSLHEAERVVLAAGFWTPELLPGRAMHLQRALEPVWHLRPKRPQIFRPAMFPVFVVDGRPGYYGFPLHPVHAVVKVGCLEGAAPPTVALDLEGEPAPSVEERAPSAEETEELRQFLAATIPDLADAEVVHASLFPSCRVAGGQPWIFDDPELPGLTVAAGGGAHDITLAPLLGELVADAVEGRRT